MARKNSIPEYKTENDYEKADHSKVGFEGIIGRGRNGSTGAYSGPYERGGYPGSSGSDRADEPANETTPKYKNGGYVGARASGKRDYAKGKGRDGKW